jgi:SAM-dependent methyltransferase
VAETYTLRGHAAMIADRVRMDAYQAALERTVRPGSVVLDIGTGTGLMALMACRLGARRVFAADPGDSIRLARAAARASGFADRIEFIQGLSTQIELPERADVIVSDLRGVLPLFQHHVASLADARDRLLAPGGVLIPRMDTLFAAPVQAEKDYQAIVGPWDDHGRGFALDTARRAALNEWNKSHFGADDLLAAPRVWAVLDYRTERNPHVRGTLRWTAERAATSHGFAVWFDAELAEGVGFTTGPDGAKTIYGTAFFPWLAPVPDPGRVRVGVEHARGGARRRKGALPPVHLPGAAGHHGRPSQAGARLQARAGRAGPGRPAGAGDDGRRRHAGADRARAAAPLSGAVPRLGRRAFARRPAEPGVRGMTGDARRAREARRRPSDAADHVLRLMLPWVASFLFLDSDCVSVSSSRLP